MSLLYIVNDTIDPNLQQLAYLGCISGSKPAQLSCQVGVRREAGQCSFAGPKGQA